MAKRAVPGRVKTRLIGALTPKQTAFAHAAMRDCVMDRLVQILAADGEEKKPAFRLALDGAEVHDVQDVGPIGEGDRPSWRLIDQGEGDLGERIARVWEAVGGGSAAFFGVDSPDVPAESLRRLASVLDDADAAVGPTDDGGYWCLAGREPLPALLRGIDWGTSRVYDQTRSAARRAGLRLAELPAWHDVDDGADLDALLARLTDIQTDHEPHLRRLRDRLTAICKDST